MKWSIWFEENRNIRETGQCQPLGEFFRESRDTTSHSECYRLGGPYRFYRPSLFEDSGDCHTARRRADFRRISNWDHDAQKLK